MGNWQIPTKTGAVVHAFHLHVASPQAVILGGQVSHVDILTPSLTLVCIVDNVNMCSLTPYYYSYSYSSAFRIFLHVFFPLLLIM